MKLVQSMLELVMVIDQKYVIETTQLDCIYKRHLKDTKYPEAQERLTGMMVQTFTFRSLGRSYQKDLCRYYNQLKDGEFSPHGILGTLETFYFIQHCATFILQPLSRLLH